MLIRQLTEYREELLNKEFTHERSQLITRIDNIVEDLTLLAEAQRWWDQPDDAMWPESA
jgi:hypothetical protein